MKGSNNLFHVVGLFLYLYMPDNLALAYEAMYRGGNMPCIVNAANEVVVASFLKDGISFLGMSDVIEKTMERVAFIANPTYDDYVATDAEARKIAASLI